MIKPIFLKSFFLILTCVVLFGNTVKSQTFVQLATVYQNTTATTISKAFTSTSTTGNLIIVHLDWDGQTRNISALTDSKGNTYHLISGPTNWNGTNYRADLWYAYNITGGGGTAITVTATLSGAPTSFSQIYIAEYSGIRNISTPLDQNAVAIGTAASESSGSKTTLATDELIFGISIGSNGVINSGTGFTLRSVADQNIVEDKNVTSTGSYSATFSNTNPGVNNWIAQMATFVSKTNLPIELVSFTGEFDNNAVVLKWATATEINNDYFTIERSTDGEEYTQIATVKGAGNSNSILNYSTIDNSPIYGTTYYRLKQTDYNGKAVTFKSIAVICSDVSSSFNVFPNPNTGNEINLSFMANNSGDNFIVNISDITGREVFEKTLIADNKGLNSFIINPELNLKRGIYFLSGSINNSQYTKKLVIQ